jgi:hypothetical protein
VVAPPRRKRLARYSVWRRGRRGVRAAAAGRAADDARCGSRTARRSRTA